MKTTTTRTTQDRLDGIVRQVSALGRDRSEWELDDLDRLTQLRHLVSGRLHDAVYSLRDAGYTDTEIGRRLGTTQQAVSKRWPGGGRYVGAAGRYRKPDADTT